MTPRQAVRRAEFAGAAVIGVIGAYILFGIQTASTTLGCDFFTYTDAVRAWLAGQPIYDLTVSTTGMCGIYQYPPPFLFLVAPFAALNSDVGMTLWVVCLVACWSIGTAVLPVGNGTRWLVLLLGGIGWPLVFSLRLGQVTPVVYLVYALAWRCLDRPRLMGSVVAIGTLVKLQPALLGIWFVVRRDWKAVVAMLGLLGAIGLVGGTFGLGNWIGLFTLFRSLVNAVTIPTNLAIGATALSLGASYDLAGALQAVNTVAVLAVVVFSGLRFDRTVGFLIAVVASQAISPIVWSHYALLLMLPVAWFLDRRIWWSALVPLSEAWVLLPFLPNWIYPVAFYGVLIALVSVGMRTRTSRRRISGPMPTAEFPT